MYQKVKNSDEYLQCINKIIIYLKDQVQNTNQNNSNLNAMLQQGTAVRAMGQGVTSGGQMVHNNPGQMANQLQMVHTGNPGAQMLHGPAPGAQMTHAGVADNQVGPGGMIQNTLVPGPNRMSHMMAANMGNQAELVNWSTNKPRRPNDMILINVNAKPPTMGNLNQINAQPGKLATLSMPQNEAQVNQMTVGGRMAMQQPRVPSPSFSVSGPIPHPRQGTPTPSVASPASQQQIQQQSQQHGVSHSSLTFISPSPSSNAVPSPAGSTGGGRGMNQLGAPSPGGMINTPGQPQQQPSPAAAGVSLEDRAYVEKVKELQSKYLERLREVVQRFGNNDSENTLKVRKLLEVIENPHRRAPKGMETLKACELVMERLQIQQKEPRSDGGVVTNTVTPPAAVPTCKPVTKEKPITVLFDAINFSHKSPLGVHTIHRTISPALKTLLGPDFGPSLPKKMMEETLTHTAENPLISDIVQGEIARLPSRFKVNLDSQQLGESDDLTLSCQLDDPNLPCVPSIILIIPPSYPTAPPRCRLTMVEYDTTPFLKKVREIMINRQFHLPEVCSLTMILDSWEMSVRRACSSKPFNPDAINPLINLNIFSK